MSFTAQVKDELGRTEGMSITEQAAQLSAMIRVSGSLVFQGKNRFSVQIPTETGSVVRTIYRLCRNTYDLSTTMDVRRSRLHKSRNYLIEIHEEPNLARALVNMGILGKNHEVLTGTPKALLSSSEARSAFIRGAFMASGFVADPRSRFHLEISVPQEEFAYDMLALVCTFGVDAKVFRRRNMYVIYIKTADDVQSFLKHVGAYNSEKIVELSRARKSVKNTVNRRINAEMANEVRAAASAAEQLELIRRASALLDIPKLPSALKDFCAARVAYPEKSLVELGAYVKPPASKSAMYHRYLRLKKLVEEAEVLEVSKAAEPSKKVMAAHETK